MSISMATRRRFLAGIGATAAAAGLARPALAQAKPKLVVIGGGPGGATVAKYVARASPGAIEVTLVEPADEVRMIASGEIEDAKSICGIPMVSM